jgi:hypothetical protein
MRLYTTAQAVVDQEAYRHHHYDKVIPKIEKTIATRTSAHLPSALSFSRLP